METEELIKLVDGIYKNILDKFNPGARQMINAGKAYLKALHGAAAASRLYVDAISKLARQAQQGTWGGSSDVGAALMKIVEVYKEIQDQQMNILKAFYVDLLVPLETNLEKDTKVVQSEQKRFLQQHKQRAETYSKAAAMMKKQRKKSRSGSKTGLAMDKELKNMQVLEEEKTKLDAFCEQSLKNAMTQERRRYGFVLERQCSLAKHHLSYHTQGVNAYQQNIEKWSEVAKTREFLPDSVENIFANRLRNMSVWQDEDVYSNPRSPNFDEDRMSITSQLRKTKSMDASCLDIRSIGDVGSPKTIISRAKSEYNLNSSTHSLIQDEHHQSRRPKSMAVPPPPQWDTQLARALYAYLSSGENQLSFLEGDLIALIGERNKGWQFGENLRTQCSGWFPLAYTEMLDDTNISSPSHRNENGNNQNKMGNQNSNNSSVCQEGIEHPSGNSNTIETTASRMFGDTVNLHRSSNNAKQQIRRAIASNNIPPPQLPAPIPTPSLPYQKTGLSQSQSTANFTTATSTQHGIKTSSSNFNFQTAPSITGAYSTHPQPSKSDRPTAGANLPLHLQNKGGKIGGPVGNVSLHSSNDSGFSNDPPPQPEIDYSDDDSIPGQTKLTNSMSRRGKERRNDSNNNSLMRNSTVRHSQSHGALSSPSSGKQFNISNDETLSREHKHLIKRTKSFWKFGKNNSDSEILEGMALWRHRDLVDVENDVDQKKKTGRKQKKRDISNDSERTINNNNNNVKTLEKSNSKNYPAQKPENYNRVKKEPENDNDFYKETKRKNTNTNNMENHFYDDEDGLMLKTVNRKNILKRYNNEDSSEVDSDSDETTTDDPYDIIKHEKMNHQNFNVNNPSNNANFPNVAEIGKKLEKLSKSNKYVNEKNKLNNNMNRNEQTEHFSKQQNNTEQRKNQNEKKHRQSYETIESDLTENDSKRYYETYDSDMDNRRYLPKLTKPNNDDYNDDLMGYGQSLQRRMKNTEYESKYDDRSSRNGNMYGPWYDLWGLDATSENKRRLN